MNDKAVNFRNLHTSGNTFIMANAWNAGSAILLEEAGFGAIGTTSARIAYCHGIPDSQRELSFNTALEETRKIADAVKIPVSMDSENAYGDSPEVVFNNMKLIAETGVVGASIEDNGGGEISLYDIELATDRVRSAKEAVVDLGYPFILTARAECYLTGHPDPYPESIKRINRYREAGADCLYVPGIKYLETIKMLVDEVDGPVNIVMGLAGSPISYSELKQAGVTRISIGGSLARATFGLIRKAAEEMLNNGTFNYSSQQIADAELCKLFSNRFSQKNSGECQ